MSIADTPNDEFMRRKDEQSDVIRRDLALLRRDRKLWTQHRRLNVLCGRCGNSVIEIMQASEWRIVLYHGTTPDPDAVAPAGASVQEHLRARLGHRDEIRRDDDGARFSPIPHITGPDSFGSQIDAVCRCRQHAVPGEWLHDALQRGVQRIVLRPGTL